MNDCKNGDCGCGCCEGTEVLTPRSVANRPGLETLSYRTGTHAAFLESMKARLSSKEYPALRALTTRQEDDTAIAMLDAGATMLDVLTFYQERIANEGYLRTATERRSILELARLVGYKLRPGVAASVYLAFTLENGYPTEIPAGTRAQSIPAPGELPQAFETSEPLQARPEWNTLLPRMTRPTYVTLSNVPDLDTIYFVGTSTNLSPNDPLLFVFGSGDNQQVLRLIEKVEVEAAENRTKVTLQQMGDPGTSQSMRGVIDTTLVVNEIKATVDKFLNLDEFKVTTGRTANAVVGLLKGLSETLKGNLSLEELINILDEILRQLQEQYDNIPITGTNLLPWVGATIAALQAIRDSLSTDSPDSDSTDESDDSGSSDHPGDSSTEKEKSTFGKLDAFLDKLSKRPSLQPANAKRLTRSAKTLYGAKADTLPRFLTAFNPKLKDMLYKAWANTQVTSGADLQSANALRVKAAPFGHNAPLKPVKNHEGVIIGQEEWFLENSRVISVRLESPGEPLSFYFDSAVDLHDIWVNIVVALGAETWNARVRLYDPAQPPVILGDLIMSIQLFYGKENLEEAKFSFFDTNEVLQKSISVLFDGETKLMRVRVDQDTERPILAGQFLYYSSENHRVKIVFGEYGANLTVSDEASFPIYTELNHIINLDAEYNKIIPNSWVEIERNDWVEPKIFRVIDVKTVSMAAYGITGKATQLTLNDNWLDVNDTSLAVYRNTTVYAQSEELTLAEEPILADNSSADEVKLKSVDGQEIELDALYKGLEVGRWAIVSGERTDIKDEDGNSIPGVLDSELVMLAGVTEDVQKIESASGDEIDRPGDTPHTTIQLANEGLAYAYKRDTAKIYGNVVKATHGETRNEVLGSGDSSKALQTFALKQSPLTYTSAPTMSGIESSLEARVNEVRWPEADGLVWLAGNERGYITKTDNEDKTSIIFGDGKHGARLPTGLENIKAVYRIGIGKPGNVAAKQINLLAIKPLGVKSVINPLPATGGADREDRDQARGNVPLAVMALDRLVSLQDYADFARTFAGIGKASAVELPDGRRMLVHVTIAGAEDIPIDRTSDLFLNLKHALRRFGDPYQPFWVSVRELMLLVINANVRILPDYQWESVEPRIRAALLKTFSFERRELGQDVMLSEVISVVQGVPGVAYVDVDKFDGIPESVAKDPAQLEAALEKLAISNNDLPDKEKKQPKKRVPVNLAWVDQSADNLEDRFRAAQLAYLSPEIPNTLVLSEKSL